MDIGKIINRSSHLFSSDIENYDETLSHIICKSRFLVIGGAGSIGKAVTIELFSRNPKLLHVVDLSENNLVELVRVIRSDHGYIDGEFRTFAIDSAGMEFGALIADGPDYDYVINLSAMKHVRSEKDPYSLMRMLKVNILNTLTAYKSANAMGAKKYFCVSTDKAANPVNLMGASKKIMELCLSDICSDTPVSMARFANVAFSDGSLLHGFTQRLLQRQPITAPSDISRYFITPKESGELCLLSIILGENEEIFYPKERQDFKLTYFSSIVENFLKYHGYEMQLCTSEQEARDLSHKIIDTGKWPVYLFESDTTGEKPYEEFFTSDEVRDLNRFSSVGVIKGAAQTSTKNCEEFLSTIDGLLRQQKWSKSDILDAVSILLPDFTHFETGKYLDGRM